MIASNGVRSSQAISTMRDRSASDMSFVFAFLGEFIVAINLSISSLVYRDMALDRSIHRDSIRLPSTAQIYLPNSQYLVGVGVLGEYNGTQWFADNVGR